MCSTNGAVSRDEFMTLTECKYSIKDLYPGDEYVDFILVFAMNEQTIEQTGQELVRKAVFAAEQASNSK